MILRAATARWSIRGAVRRHSKRGHAGLTLIEIMVVILIIGLLMGAAALSLNGVSRARLRTAAMRMSATFRFAYVHALTTGHTTRVSVAMGRPNAPILVEYTEDAHTLDSRDPMRAGGAADVEAEARRGAERMTEPRPRANRASFRPLPRNRFPTRELGEGVLISRLYSQHEEEPREEGVARIYFFPGGIAERVTMHLRNTGGEVYSVALQPLTGRAQIFDRPIEPPTIDIRDERDDREVDERDRPPPQEARTR